MIMRILVPRAVGPVGRARPAGAAIFVAAPRAPGTIEVAVMATEASLAPAGAKGSLVTALVAWMIAAPVAIPVVIAVGLTPLWPSRTFVARPVPRVVAVICH